VIFTTEHSTYRTRRTDNGPEIMRVSSDHEPTPKQGLDGQWRPYQMMLYCLGSRAVIYWDVATHGLTVTSRVMSIDVDDHDEESAHATLP
jgi:hypothetical protein